MAVRPEVPVRFTSRNDTTKEKMMGDRDKGNSDEKTTTDGDKPQGGSRGTGDRTNGNPNDGKRS